MRKNLIHIIAVLTMLAGVSCNADAKLGKLANQASPSNDMEETEAAAPQATVSPTAPKGKDSSSYTVNGHTYTMQGTLNIKTYDAAASGKVTFTHVPSNYAEFEEIYTQFLGKTPHGVAAMMPMAMEMYGRNRAEGEKCIRLINYPSNVNSVLSQLKEKFGTNQYAPAIDSYHQRYLPAAMLEGATPTNAYTPSYPYTVNMKASVNTHKDMQLYDGRVMYIYIMGKGWDTEQRSVEIVQTSDSELFKIFNCPALYTQCKNIKGTWEGLK